MSISTLFFVLTPTLFPKFSLKVVNMELPALTIYNFPPQPPKWDCVGVFYITFCATWTAIVVAGMVFCWVNRHLPILRVRGLGLPFAAVISLHLYWIMAQITYPVGATMPLVIAYSVQYFVMGTWFPLGIALFHAANLRFLHVAKLQKQFARPYVRKKRGCDGAHTSWLCNVRNLEYNTKVMTLITIGLVVQVWHICTLKEMNVLTCLRLSSLSVCGWLAGSIIPPLEFQAPRSVVRLYQNSSGTWVLDGSGGLVLRGSSSGPGVLLLRSSGERGTSATLWAGAHRRLGLVSLGTFIAHNAYSS